MTDTRHYDSQATVSEYTGSDAHTVAKRKARYSHREWVTWIDKQGVRHAAVCSYDSLKAAMLANGTQGGFTVYEGSTGIPMWLVWRVAVSWLANHKVVSS